jgi:hypothetical protein
MMKGFAIALNLVVVIAIAVIVIAAIGVFFMSSSFQTVSSTEAQRIFASGCTRYCSSSLYDTFRNAYLASQNDQQFIGACVALGFMDRGSTLVNRCLEKCGNCNLEVTQGDVESGYDYIDTLSSRG